jgi:cytochrome c-type biogenesis protein CcmF
MEGTKMIPQLGNYLLLAALALSLLQTIRPFCPKLLTVIIFSITALSFGGLIYSHAISDFSVLNVYNNSSTYKPMIYKITGTWGNHEGSMLLIALILAAYNFAFMQISSLESSMKKTIIRIQSFITAGFLSFITFTSNPFEVIAPVPDNGLGLNPLLQDIGLATHPPVLYIGYIGLSLALSFCVMALLRGEADKTWASHLKKWTLFSWSHLTFGVGLGAWWAYRELGWGGFWMWDPVENASFMPWLASTALIHCLIVMEKRETLKIFTILLGIFTFSLSLLGIFLVRSGVLTSVHSFASDPSRGVFILLFLGIVIIGSFLLFGLKAHHLKNKNNFTALSKESGILIGNMLLAVACSTVFLGTLYPIFLDIISGDKVSVGAPYFNATFTPIILPVLLLAAFVPMIKWQSDSLKEIWHKSYKLLIIGVITAILVYAIPTQKSFIAPIAISFSMVLIASMLNRLIEKLRASGRISYTFCAMALSHIGGAILVIGVSTVSVYGIEQERILKINESMQIGGYDIKLNEMFLGTEENYLMRQGVFSLTKNGHELTVLSPQVRHYPIENSNTTESDIYYSLLSNIYIAMGDSDGKDGFVVRVYYKPLVNLIWFSCAIMAVGGLFGLLRQKGK